MLGRIPLPPAREVPAAYAARQHARRRPVTRHWETRTRGDLLAAGARPREITAAVRSGALVRARENVYLPAETDPACIAACRVGGRLTCVSELARWGVFVLDTSTLHVEVPHTSSRLRPVGREVHVHWSRRRLDGWANVDLLDALVDAVRCQPARAAVATLDSALHLGLIEEDGLAEILRRLPRRLRVVGKLIDARAESGAETLMRLLVRTLGCDIDIQVQIDGVGRVDILVDGWLIIECDSREFHGSWEQQRADRRRDQSAAARGYTTYRPIAEDIFWHPERVVQAVRGLRGARDRCGSCRARG